MDFVGYMSEVNIAITISVSHLCCVNITNIEILILISPRGTDVAGKGFHCSDIRQGVNDLTLSLLFCFPHKNLRIKNILKRQQSACTATSLFHYKKSAQLVE